MDQTSAQNVLGGILISISTPSHSHIFVSSLKVLKLENLSSENQLKKQYKKMVKKFHPDLNDSGSNEKIIELNEAYSVLKKFFK